MNIKDMTLEEKIGQMCVPILQSGDITEDIKKAISMNIGMIRYCPNAEFDNNSEVVGKPNRYMQPDQMAEFLNNIQRLSKIPLLIAIDQEGSTRNDINRAGVLTYAGHMAFGVANDQSLTYQVAKATAEQLRCLGINLVQAPIVDVLRYEGRKTMKAATFGADVDVVTKHALAMLKGFKDGGIAAMAKHFPGYGSVATDAHKGIAEITKPLELFEGEDVMPMKSVIDAGVDGIMTGHAIVHCIDPVDIATVSPKVLNGYLRGRLGFNGIIESDAMRMKAVQNRYGTARASVLAVIAGCDLILLRGSFEHFKEGYDAVLNGAKRGEISLECIDAAVERIFKVKRDIGLFDNALVAPHKSKKIIGCTEHLELSKRLAKASVYAYRKKDLPLDNCGKIVVVSVKPQKIEAAMDNIQSIDMLAKAIASVHKNTCSLMTKLAPDTSDIRRAVEACAGADVIVVGTCNAIIYNEQFELVKKLFDTGKKLIVVAMDSPFDIEGIPYADNYIATYGVANDWMTEAASIIFNNTHQGVKNPVDVGV